jgi:hypothetical protein
MTLMLQWCPRENSSKLQSDTFLVEKSSAASSRILALQRLYAKLQAMKSSFMIMKAGDVGKGGGVSKYWCTP